MLYLKITTEPVIVRTKVMIKKETDKHIDKMPSSPSQYEL